MRSLGPRSVRGPTVAGLSRMGMKIYTVGARRMPRYFRVVYHQKWPRTLLLSTPALALEMGIVTGNPEGTYYQIGVDIRKVVSRYDINLNVHPSAGSIANVYSIYKEPGVQLGIVQSDVLAFIQQVSDNKELKPIAQKTKMVFTLYNEE